MQQKIKQLKVRREFSEEFKRARVKEFETGQFTVKELSILYQIAPRVIDRWIHRYSLLPIQKVRIVEIKDSSTYKLKQMQERIKELERIVGVKQIQIDLLESLIDEAKETLGVDIKKSSCTMPYDESDNEKKEGPTL